ncbi:MAG: xanthine permease [Deltaproteobacteria bacterium]|nr:MAG: xanthine permease [Deltaproteobacteria bacterium]
MAEDHLPPTREQLAAGGKNLLYGIDDKPPLRRAIPLGIQHYLTMFGSTVAIPLFLAGPLGIADQPDKLATLIATMFFVSGLTTLLQTTWGNRLPIVQGGTFSILNPAAIVVTTGALQTAGFEIKMQELQGAIIAGGLVEVLFGYSGLIGRLLKFIGPVTIAPTIALIGLSLFKFGAPKAGTDWLLGGVMIALVILFSQILNRRWAVFELFPILLAILGTWALASILTAAGHYQPGDAGFVDWSKVGQADFAAIPTPFPYGMPRFEVSAFIALVAGYLASMIESIGDYYACARLSGAPTPTRKTINRGIGMEGVGSVLAGIMGTGNATTSYSENIGAIGLTRVGSRRVVQIGAVVMLILGAFPKFGALFTSIPEPIIGGMYCTLFGMIAAVGLSNLQFVDLNSGRNLFVIGFAFFMGLSVPEYFATSPVTLGEDWTWLANIINTIGRTGMAVGAICATVLDNLIPGTPEERGLTHLHAGD